MRLSIVCGPGPLAPRAPITAPGRPPLSTGRTALRGSSRRSPLIRRHRRCAARRTVV